MTKGIKISTNLKFKKKYGLNLKYYSRLIKKGHILFHWQNFLKYHIFHNLQKRIIQTNIKTLIDIRHYRGMRFKVGYPVNGQRTHTNAKTIKKLYKKKLLY